MNNQFDYQGKRVLWKQYYLKQCYQKQYYLKEVWDGGGLCANIRITSG